MKEDQDKHFTKMLILFAAMEEESTYLIGELKRNDKLIFNRWRKETMRILKIVERSSDMGYIDQHKDKVHESLKTM